jgi:hypothetical protein
MVLVKQMPVEVPKVSVKVFAGLMPSMVSAFAVQEQRQEGKVNLLEWAGRPFPFMSTVTSRFVEEEEETILSYPSVSKMSVPSVKLPSLQRLGLTQFSMPSLKGVQEPRSSLRNIQISSLGLGQIAGIKQVQRLSQMQKSKMLQELKQAIRVDVPNVFETETRKHRRRKRGKAAMWEAWSFTVYPIPEFKDLIKQMNKLVG